MTFFRRSSNAKLRGCATIKRTKTRDFWERNLRFKTDVVSDDGPQKGAPAIVPAGMMGDRADVIFAKPGGNWRVPCEKRC